MSLRKRVLRGLRWRMALRRLQPLYEQLHAWSLYGLNVGGATRTFEASGEAGFVASLPAGRPFTCFDVGANVGDYAQLVRAHLGEQCALWCFEPAPSTFRELTANIGALPNVRCFELALSDADAKTTLYVSERSVLTSLTAQPGTTPHEVQMMRLDDFAARHGIAHIDLLKIDVEGHELAVLRGAKQLIERGAIDRIQFEYGENNIAVGARLSDFYALLGERYELHRIVRDGLWPLGAYRASLEIATSATNYVAIARALR